MVLQVTRDSLDRRPRHLAVLALRLQVCPKRRVQQVLVWVSMLGLNSLELTLQVLRLPNLANHNGAPQILTTTQITGEVCCFLAEKFSFSLTYP
jgi:hypothetical protein